MIAPPSSARRRRILRRFGRGQAPRAAVFAALLLAAGCGTVGLRLAMNHVQEEYTRLFDAAEAGKAADALKAAERLRQALLDERIVGHRFFEAEPEFRERHGEVLAALRALLEAGPQAHPEALRELRDRVRAACEGCHLRFRKQ